MVPGRADNKTTSGGSCWEHQSWVGLRERSGPWGVGLPVTSGPNMEPGLEPGLSRTTPKPPASASLWGHNGARAQTQVWWTPQTTPHCAKIQLLPALLHHYLWLPSTLKARLRPSLAWHCTYLVPQGSLLSRIPAPSSRSLGADSRTSMPHPVSPFHSLCSRH